MKAAPYSACGFGCADDRFPLEGHDFSARRVEEELDLLCDLVDLEALEADDLVAIIHCHDF